MRTVADPGEGLKPPPYLRAWMTAPPSPYLKAWIRHCRVGILTRVEPMTFWAELFEGQLALTQD